MEIAIDFSIIPNDLIRSLRRFNLTANQIELLLFIKSLTFRNSKELILSDTLRNKILDFFELSNWEHASKILNQLAKKGLILIEKLKCSIKVIFSDIFKLRRSQNGLANTKSLERVSKKPGGNNILNNILPFEKKEEYKSSIPSYIPEPKQERKNPDLNISPIREVNNTKGINTHSTQQPITREPINDIKIDNQYIKALKSQMLKYGYSSQEIDTATSLIFKAKNKNINASRIQDTAKAIIYNRIDKSAKRKPINDLKAFIISSLFSKEEKFIFHKLEHIKDFPYSEIKTEADIKAEQQQKRAAETLQLQQLEAEKRSAEQKQFETMKSALIEKLKDKYDTKLEETKRKLVKLNNWFICPEIFAVSELFNSLFTAGVDTVHNSMNS